MLNALIATPIKKSMIVGQSLEGEVMRTSKEITDMIAELEAEMRLVQAPRWGIGIMRYWLIMLYNFASAQALGYDPDSEIGKWWDGKASELDKL